MKPVNIAQQEELWNRIINYENGRFVALNAENNSLLVLIGRSLKYPNFNRPSDIESIYYDTSRKSIRMFCITITDDANSYEDIQHLVSICSTILTKENIKEWIITDGKKFWFIPTKQYQNIETLTFEAFINRLTRIFTNQISFEPQNLWNKVILQLEQNLENEFISSLNEFASLNIQDCDFECDNYSIYLKEEKEKPILEKLLLQKFEIAGRGELFRYISTNALECLLINNTISMSGLAGMNDTSELHALNSILNPNTTKRVLREEILPSIIKQDNDFFINSFCDKNKSDDLTMWRLYGDNGKGACLTFEYDINKLNDITFALLPVTYLNPSKTTQYDIIKLLNGKLSFYNRTFILRNLITWEH